MKNSNEIEQSMQDYLIANDKDENINKFAHAIDRLNAVAEIFDDLGLYSEAEATTQLIEVIAKKRGKKNKTTKKTNKAKNTKNLNPERMVKNLKEKGWVFNNNDHYECMCSMCMDDRNFIDDFEDELLDEDEVEVPRRRAIFPPPIEEMEKLPNLRHYKPTSDSWQEIEEDEYTGNSPTVRPGKFRY